jgi:uncharacterized protein (DUF362 family)
VGDVYAEFERQIEGWKRQFAGQPRRELLHLCFLALEREELVSVAYRETLIEARLRSMPIPEEVRRIILQALVWAWKDEEMHAIYIRGAIFRLGSAALRGRAFARQMAGAVGGWSSSVCQHVPWRQAPLSRTLSGVILGLGSVTGQVPVDVRKHLRYGPFRDFCLFNVDAERTAWLAWKRLDEVAAELPELPPTLIEEFRRVQDDERRHEQIFSILAAALDAEDRLVPGETAQTLAEKIGAVGEYFVPRAQRRETVAGNPVGSGGTVYVVEGSATGDKLAIFRRLLDDSGLDEQLRERAADLGKSAGELTVAVKPSFMMGYHLRDRSPITDPELLVELARYLHEAGCRTVYVVEARNIYDRFYQHRSVTEVARYFGIESSLFEVVDLSDEQVPCGYVRGMAQYTIGRTWRDADFRISFGKLRSHPAEGVSLAIGNLEGTGTRCEEFFFVERQTHRDTGLMMLLDAFPPHFSLLDGYDLAPDGLVGVMGCPRAKSPRRFYAGVDPLAVDIVAARHLRLADPRRCSFIRTACHWFGDPSDSITISGPDLPVKDWRDPYHSEWSTLLSLLSMPVYRFGSCRGALFVPEMDPVAFPPLEPEPLAARLARSGVRAFLGLRLPRKRR